MYHRYVINFGERDEEECRRRWPELMAIVEENVKPERITKDAKKYPRMVNEWWKFWNARPELHAASQAWNACLSRTAARRLICRSRFSHPTASSRTHSTSFRSTTLAAFCALQSRPHEVWARFFSSR